MRKRISSLLVLILLIRLFAISVVGAYDVENWAPTKEEHTLVSGQPYWVEQVEKAHRYAVDVIYADMTIYVESAIWDVNNYQYVVTMKHGGGDSAPFTFDITVINHSDLVVNAEIGVEMDGDVSGLVATMSPSDGKLALPAVEENAELNSVKGMASISIAPTDGWQDYINSLIVWGIPDSYVCPVGTVTLTIKR